MFKNYFIIAWRNLVRNRLLSMINLIGLTVSLAIALIVYLIVQHETSYNKHYQDAGSIYRVVSKASVLGEDFHNPGVPIPLAAVLEEESTGIRAAAGFFRLHNYTASIGGGSENQLKTFKHQGNLVLTGPSYFNILDHHWLSGTPETALSEPFQVVLTERKAREYFGLDNSTEAMGRVILYNDSIQAKVSGILQDHQHPTDFEFQEFLSIGTIASSELKERWYLEHWDNLDSDFQIIVKLKNSIQPQAVDAQIASLYGIHDPNPEYPFSFSLQPLNDLHFNATYQAFMHPVASRTTLWGLTIIALLLLALGSINYINLTTASGSRRSREIGVRKSLGGTRKNFVLQIVTETLVLSFIAGMGALLLAPIAMEWLSELLPSSLQVDEIWQPHLMLFLLALCLLVGFISGIYPGLVMSKRTPVSVISGKYNLPNSRSSYVQAGFTVLQFAVASFFITTSLVIGLQIRHALSLEMGFDKEDILTFIVPNDDQGSATFLFNRLNMIPEIIGISRAGASPASTGVQSQLLYYSQGDELAENHVVLKYGDENYMEVYGLQLLAGQNISHSDTIKEFIINETFMSQLGIDNPNDAIGKGLQTDEQGIQIPIVGVVSDFHHQPIHQPIRSVAITNGANRTNFHIKLSGSDGLSHAIEKIEQVWKEVFPDEPLDYQFYDQRVASWYQQEKRTAKLLKLTTCVSIFISCLGLLGMVVLITTKRIKEIGIRLVVGASRVSLVALLSKKFLHLMLISLAISWPLVWWFISDWLQNYAYPIPLSWWMFALPGCLMLIIVQLTIMAHVIKAVNANPVEALRYE